jgi:tetratricopeptide (TPR) repeat protein
MKPTALFAISLFVALANASNLPKADLAVAGHPGAASSARQDSAAPAPMTPLEVAQMRADLLMARKDYTEAAVAYQRLLEQNPRNAEILNKIGIAYQELGEDNLAEHFYKRSARADAKAGAAVNNLGTIEYSRQRFGKALKYYKKAIAIGGENLAPIYTNLGYAYCSVKLYPQAMDAFGKALALDPNIFEPRGTAGSIVQHRTAADEGTLYFLVAKSYAKLGDAEHAARYLKLARDDGYKNFLAAEKDPDFARVIKDPQVQDVLHRRPPYEAQQSKPVAN